MEVDLLGPTMMPAEAAAAATKGQAEPHAKQAADCFRRICGTLPLCL